jgi:hypothetical protein
MQRFGLMLFTVCLLSTSFLVADTTAADLPAQVKVGSEVLSLNGTGVRKKSFLSLYTAGLYLKEKSASASGIIRANEPMSIRIKITSKFVSRDNLTSALKEGFQSSTNGRTESIREEIQSFTGFLSGDIEMGDVFDLVYVPGTGVVVLKNGKRRGTVGDLEFKQALFGIWLSNQPADSNLKKGLLGS